MKPILAASSGLAALAFVLAIGAGSALAAGDMQAFKVHNNLGETVNVWVASEKNSNANPWAHVEVAPDQNATINLGSPDRFIIAVDIGKQRSRSKPVALKAFLAAHPDYVLKINLDQTIGDTPDSPTKYKFNFVPTKPSGDNTAPKSDPNAPPVETPRFDFSSEGLSNDNGQ